MTKPQSTVQCSVLCLCRFLDFNGCNWLAAVIRMRYLMRHVRRHKLQSSDLSEPTVPYNVTKRWTLLKSMTNSKTCYQKTSGLIFFLKIILKQKRLTTSFWIGQFNFYWSNYELVLIRKSDNLEQILFYIIWKTSLEKLIPSFKDHGKKAWKIILI